jgi:FkbH-like protein
MYEAEVNTRFESNDTVPADVLNTLSELSSDIIARTVLPWGEHCTECAWPTCYMTCELYSPRIDGNCRLFVDGMVRVDLPDGGIRPYLLKLHFKRWGKLWTVGTLTLYSSQQVEQKEKLNATVGAIARSLPLPAPLKSRVIGKVAYLRRRWVETAAPSDQTPDSFVLECYNPHSPSVELTLTIRPRQHDSRPPFQAVVRVPQGFVRHETALADIKQLIDLSQPFEVEIVPNDAENIILYFGLIDFVKRRTRRSVATDAPSTKPLKCIVWDLDNTLWEGTLIEDGPARLRLRDEVAAVIRETDRRGILHSVASKNNPVDAMAVLKTWGLDDYFLHPQITWEPKSHSVARIAKLLNIGTDSLLFVDDQPFEREEVVAALPEVAVRDVADVAEILVRPECQTAITEESRQRRLMYRQEHQREVLFDTFRGDYAQFLRDCKIQILLDRLDSGNLERVYELAQRTNQMNFSGVRYSRAQLREIQGSNPHDTYVIRCTDRFGTYGIVGFGLVAKEEPRLLDLMFSCRIQGKRVEHAFLAHLLNTFRHGERRDFFANFKKTDRNASHGHVFEEVGFEVVATEAGVLSLMFPKHRTVPQDDILTIVDGTGTRE